MAPSGLGSWSFTSRREKLSTSSSHHGNPYVTYYSRLHKPTFAVVRQGALRILRKYEAGDAVLPGHSDTYCAEDNLE